MKKIEQTGIAILCLSLMSCGSDGEPSGAAPVKVKIRPAAVVAAGSARIFSGTVEAESETAISFPVSGTVGYIAVDVGQHVAKGQLLAEVDATSMQSAYDAACAMLSQARDAHARMKRLYDKGSLPEIQWVEVQSKLQQAESMERIARKNLDDCKIYAPYAGVVSVRGMEVGQQAAPGAPVVKIVKIGRVKVKISVPEAEIADDGLLQMEMAPGQRMKLVEDGSGIGVTATLPIYAGGMIYNGNKLAKIGVEVGELKLRQTENEVRLTVEQYYWQIVVLKEKLRTVETVERQLARIAEDVTAAVDAGVANRNDLLQVNLRKNDMQSTRMDLDNTLALCKMVLAQFIGAEQSTVDVASSIGDELPAAPGYLRTDHEAALDSTPEYRLLNKNVEASKLQKRMALGEHLPKVAVGGGYLYTDFTGFSQNRFLGYVSVSVPISWKAPHSVKKQRYRYRNAVTQLEDGAEQLVIRMQKAWNDLDNAYRQMSVAANSIEQSTENLRLNEDYYKAGTSTMSDLLDAQTLFRQSRDRYVEAWSQYEIKKTEYLQATGR